MQESYLKALKVEWQAKDEGFFYCVLAYFPARIDITTVCLNARKVR